MKNSIRKIWAREVLDSRGNPTLEVDVETEGGDKGTAIVPSGASTGYYEALELRDGGKRYHGKGVLKAVTVVNEKIAPILKGFDVREQESVDRLLIEMDGTENKSSLGGNTLLGVSIACAKAAAASENLNLYEYVGERKARLLPAPFFNVINGGMHAGNKLDFQEFMVAPVRAESFKEALRIGSEVYHALKNELKSKYGRTAINVGDEGGFTPPISLPEEALDAVAEAIEEMGYGGIAYLAMDVAANSFHEGEGRYNLAGRKISGGELIDQYSDLVGAYPIISIEDPLEEEDFEGFAELTRKLNIQILGDDIFVTNSSRLLKGIKMGAANALLWKVNQVGTLTEAFEAAELAKKNGYRVQASHRSGDSEDTFVSDLSVGISCGQIKSGAPARGERTAKYNRLLRIEEILGSKAEYPTGLLTS